MSKYYLILAFLFTAQMSSGQDGAQNPKFTNYWYSQGAEISRFKLSQSRYGEHHTGNAVMIFVTEPMNPSLQVKADQQRPDNVPVLKLNSMRKFNTGIYPYSIMTSIFSPIDTAVYPSPLKITFSMQEWCGHIFSQMNLRDNAYILDSKSYFEQESDTKSTLANVLTEDGLLTRIRLNPKSLPLGEFTIIPGLLISRLLHVKVAVVNVSASIQTLSSESLEGNDLVEYTIKFPQLKRILKISFEKTFPHRIHEIQDTYPPNKYFGNKILTTKLTRTHTIYSPYWQKNKNIDRNLLNTLGLDK